MDREGAGPDLGAHSPEGLLQGGQTVGGKDRSRGAGDQGGGDHWFRQAMMATGPGGGLTEGWEWLGLWVI